MGGSSGMQRSGSLVQEEGELRRPQEPRPNNPDSFISSEESVTITLGSDASDSEETRLTHGGNAPHTHSGVRYLHFNESVFDHSFLAPLVHKSIKGTRLNDGSIHWHGLRTPWLLLMINFLLQFAIIYVVHNLVKVTAESAAVALMGDEASGRQGVCSKVSGAALRTLKLGSNSSDGLSLWECSPGGQAMVMLYNFDLVDLNHDGVWSREEAENITGPCFGQRCTLGGLRRTWDRLVSHLHRAAHVVASDDRLVQLPVLQAYARQLKTELVLGKNATLSRALLEREVLPFLDMCLLMDKNLCGNLVYRGMLNLDRFGTDLSLLPLSLAEDRRVDTSRANLSDSMSALCELSVSSICPALFGSEFDMATMEKTAMCGIAIPQQAYVLNADCQATPRTLEEARELKGGRGGGAKGRGKKANFKKGAAGLGGKGGEYPDGDYDVVLTYQYANYKTVQLANSTFYRTFLALMLSLWSMAMLEEFHHIFSWWRVIPGLAYAKHQQSYSECVVCDKDAIKVVAVPRCHVRSMIVLNMLPRTIVACLLLPLGTRFLIHTANCMDLILNSLALAFLISIDELMFTALVAPQRKKWIRKAEPMAAKHHIMTDYYCNTWPVELILLVVVGTIVGLAVVLAYRSPGGKFDAEIAMGCLCQAEGPHCFSAWVYGDALGV